MSLNPITVDVVRDEVTEDEGGGEDTAPVPVLTGLTVTISYPDKSALMRYERGAGPTSGPGPLTRSDRVVFYEPWDGSVLIDGDTDIQQMTDARIVPNPPVSWLPAAMNVVGVRGYEDGSRGQLQLDVEDVT